MKEKIKCKKCGLFIDDDLEICPYCGTPTKDDENEVKVRESNEKIIVNKEEKKEIKKEKVKFFDFESAILPLSLTKSVLLFVIGFLGLNLVATILKVLVTSLLDPYVLNNQVFGTALNAGSYLIVFGIFMLVLYDDWIKVFKTFLSGRKWLEGLGYGFLLLVIGSTISLIFNLIRPSNENLNQQNIEGIVDLYPLISILVFGIIGPIFEELTYRAGLFNILNRWNKVLAYLGTSIFFGLIHFNLSGDIIGELINLPSYIVSGLLLCYFYDYGGFGAACIAHITNNLVGILIQIIL